MLNEEKSLNYDHRGKAFIPNLIVILQSLSIRLDLIELPSHSLNINGISEDVASTISLVTNVLEPTYRRQVA